MYSAVNYQLRSQISSFAKEVLFQGKDILYLCCKLTSANNEMEQESKKLS